MPDIQYVTLVAQGGVPVRLADQLGAPYPTTGSGALVFANSPTLTGVTFGAGSNWQGNPIPVANGGTGLVGPQQAALDAITGFVATGIMSRAGAGNYTFNSLSALMDAAFGSVQGRIIYRSGSAWTSLDPGTNGQFLQTLGANANPQWGNPSGSGTVTSVGTNNGLTGGPVTTTGFIGLAPIANGTLLGNTAGSSQPPVSTTVSALLDSAISATRGSILYRGAAGWVALAPGTAGLPLTTGGAGADPSWSNLNLSHTTGSLPIANLAAIPAANFVANLTAGAAAPAAVSAAAVTAALTTFTNTQQGVVPGSGGGTTNFLRADGTWALPPGGGGGSGTVNAGVINQLAFYAANGTAVSGTNTVPNNVAATTQAVPSFDELVATDKYVNSMVGNNTLNSADLGAILLDAFTNGYVAYATRKTYTVASPILINLTADSIGAGFDGRGCVITSTITNGSDVITIQFDPAASGHNLRNFVLSNFTINGSGTDGNLFVLRCAQSTSFIYDFALYNCVFNFGGGHGMWFDGSVFEFTIFNCWCTSNSGDGAHFTNNASGGIFSAAHWVGGGARTNGGCGIQLANFGPTDLHIQDAYMVLNNDVGIYASNGISGVDNCGFEMNQTVGLAGNNFGHVTNSTMSSSGRQTYGVQFFLSGNEITLHGCDNQYYGTPPDTTFLLHTTGTGMATSDTLNQNYSLSAGTVFIPSPPLCAPTTTVVTSTYTMAPGDMALIFNATADCTLTLQLATTMNGQEVTVKTIAAHAVISASANVVPLAGGAAGTAILPATAGKFAKLRSDGTNWIIMEAN